MIDYKLWISFPEGKFKTSDKPLENHIQVIALIKGNCKDCYGTGQIGTDSKRNQILICNCIKKAFNKRKGKYNQ